MGAKAEQGKYRPFHETIVDAILGVDSPREMFLLGGLLQETKIPQNHDIIIDSWENRRRFLGLSDHDLRLMGVKESVLEQKQKFEDNERVTEGGG